MAELEAEKLDRDPIASLHKMSATAGVATSEYVAINNLGVASLLVAMFGLLMLVLNTLALVVLPAAALILGIFSIRQISQSNGTQTGRAFALGGIGVALAICAAQGGRQYLDWKATQPDRDRVEKAIREVSAAFAAGDYPKAYEWFHPDYKSWANPKVFAEHWQRYHVHPGLGKFQAFQSTGLVQFFEEGNRRFAATKMIIRYEKGSVQERANVALLQDPKTGDFLICGTDLHQRPPRGVEPDEGPTTGPMGPPAPRNP